MHSRIIRNSLVSKDDCRRSRANSVGNSNYGYRRGEAAPRRPGYGGATGTGIEVGEVDGGVFGEVMERNQRVEFSIERG